MSSAPRSLKSDALSTSLHIPRRPEHIFVNSLAFNHNGNSYSCALTINEEHEYFFDHYLDHVPGVFVIEGALQLLETVIVNDPEIDVRYNDFYVQRVKMYFSSFAEKKLPLRVEVKAKKVELPLVFMNIVVTQDEKLICRANVEVCISEIQKRISSIKDREMLVKAENAAVHKNRDQNIMVSPLVDCEQGGHSCNIIALPDGHIMLDGNQSIYSIQCLFEATKQFFVQWLHKVRNLPLNLKMILLSFDIALFKPAYRNTDIKLYCKKSALKKELEAMKITIRNCDGDVGVCGIIGMGVDDDTYLKLRFSDTTTDKGVAN